jgi:hypothetical protein
MEDSHTGFMSASMAQIEIEKKGAFPTDILLRVYQVPILGSLCEGVPTVEVLVAF